MAHDERRLLSARCCPLPPACLPGTAAYYCLQKRAGREEEDVVHDLALVEERLAHGRLSRMPQQARADLMQLLGSMMRRTGMGLRACVVCVEVCV